MLPCGGSDRLSFICEQELDRCYKKEKAIVNKRREHGGDGDQDANDSAQPEWIEMTVELFLTLLSHDTYLLRQLIARMFPQLCQHLTAQATFQILQVLVRSRYLN